MKVCLVNKCIAMKGLHGTIVRLRLSEQKHREHKTRARKIKLTTVRLYFSLNLEFQIQVYCLDRKIEFLKKCHPLQLAMSACFSKFLRP